MALVVIGASYVGLTGACCLASSGHQVICVEVDEAKLKILNQGSGWIQERATFFAELGLKTPLAFCGFWLLRPYL